MGISEKWNKKVFDRIFKTTGLKNEKKMFLENNSKKLEYDTNYIENSEYINCRNKLDKIYEQKSNGMRIRSKCDWHEYGEKSSKFFLNLEKSRPAQRTIWNITKDKKKPYMS